MLQPATALTIRPIHPDEVEAARRLLADHGWTSKVADPATFQELLRRSQVALVAVQDGEVVGFIRGLTDGIFNGYLSMVVVAQAHQGRGIGTALMRQAMSSNPEITWVLRADREGVSGFYTQLGFQPSSTALERRRR